MSLIKFKTSESSVTLMAGFENLWEMGKTPENWKRSNIACISETKKGRGRNYISVSLTKHLKKTQQPYQHNQTTFKNTQTSKEKKTWRMSFTQRIQYIFLWWDNRSSDLNPSVGGKRVNIRHWLCPAYDKLIGNNEGNQSLDQQHILRFLGCLQVFQK